MGKTEFLGENLFSFLHDQWHGLAEVNSVGAIAPCLHGVHRDYFTLCI